MKRRIFLLTVLAVVVAGASYFYFQSRLAQHSLTVDTLRVSGNIEAHESILSFKVQGRIVDLLVEEGQWLEKDSLIARLEDNDFRQQVALDEAAVRVRQAELDLALAGTRRQELEAAQQSLLDAQAELEQRKLDFERAESLYRQDAGSQQARDLAETNLKRAQAAYQRAKELYDQAREGTRQEQIAIARANVQQARERFRLSRLNLDYTLLRAPTAGVVLVRQAELGEVVAPGTPVVTMADLDHIWLRAYISETDLGRVRWGQAVVIRTDTFPSKTYRGRVSFIASKAEFTPKTIQTYKERVTLVYRIKIDVENPNHELKPGMPADAVIELDRL
jgi:HlyD family secretion protein